MIVEKTVGKIVGVSTPLEAKAEIFADSRTGLFDLVEARKDDRKILARVKSLAHMTERDERFMAELVILGEYSSDGKLRPCRVPLLIGAEIRTAKNPINPELKIAKLPDGQTDIGFKSDEIVTKHLAVLGMTGSGKSYAVSVMIEELMKNKKVAVLIFDAHGEYKCSIKEYSGRPPLNELSESEFQTLLQVLCPERIQDKHIPHFLNQFNSWKGKKEKIDICSLTSEVSTGKGDAGEKQIEAALQRYLKPIQNKWESLSKKIPELPYNEVLEKLEAGENALIALNRLEDIELKAMAISTLLNRLLEERRKNPSEKNLSSSSLRKPIVLLQNLGWKRVIHSTLCKL